MAKIYVSSTFQDLEECRRQVSLVLRRMGHEDVAMEYYVAEDQRPVDKCLADVAECDLYVGIFAWRYGWVPKKKNPKKLSITELEYRRAVKEGKTCLIFLLDDKAPWPPAYIDDNKKRVKKLRDELNERHGAGLFTSCENIGAVVVPAIHEWMKKSGQLVVSEPITQLHIAEYFAALRKRYQTLALEGLTPPQKEEYLQLQLRSVFVEQNVRENPPPVELPKEVWEKLQHEKEIHPEDLPAGITLEDVRRAREAYYEKPSRPVLDVLTDSRYQHAIILGDPGSGKSTLARYVMLSLITPDLAPSPAEQEKGDRDLLSRFMGEGQGVGAYLPLLIELRTYAGLCADAKCDTFLEFLEYLGKTEGWGLAAAALHNHLKNDGRAVVIFDGLDEIFKPDKREQITRQIVGFCNDYPKARIIVTSRVIGYRRKILTDAGFTHFTLQDLDEKQVEQFVSRWYDSAMSDRPDEAKEWRVRILKSFQESASIRQLAGNPMLLTIMAIVGKHQELPRERWKLYDHAASVLIQHWDVNKHLKDARIDADFIGEDDKKELLRRLAFRMQSGEGGLAGNYIHREQLQAEFESYLRERYAQTPDRAVTIARAMIDQFRERNFILSLYGANLYGFVHRAFLEFFCASAFVYKFEKTKELTIEQLKADVYGKHWEDQSWHEVLWLICGMVDERWAGEIIGYLANVLSRPWPEYFGSRPPRNIELAIYCMGEARNLSSLSVASESLLNLVCQLFDHAFNAGKETMSFGDYMRQQFILPMKSVGTRWPQRIVLVRWLKGLKQTQYARFYAEAFGAFVGIVGAGLESIYQVLLDYYKSDVSDFRILSLWALALGWKQEKETLSCLRDCVVNDANSDVREEALLALTKTFQQDLQILQLVRDRTVNDMDQEVRSTAIRTLAAYFYDDIQTLPLICDRAVNDASSNVRSSAVRVLAQRFGDKPQTLDFWSG